MTRRTTGCYHGSEYVLKVLVQVCCAGRCGLLEFLGLLLVPFVFQPFAKLYVSGKISVYRVKFGLHTVWRLRLGRVWVRALSVVSTVNLIRVCRQRFHKLHVSV